MIIHAVQGDDHRVRLFLCWPPAEEGQLPPIADDKDPRHASADGLSDEGPLEIGVGYEGGLNMRRLAARADQCADQHNGLQSAGFHFCLFA